MQAIEAQAALIYILRTKKDFEQKLERLRRLEGDKSNNVTYFAGIVDGIKIALQKFEIEDDVT